VVKFVGLIYEEALSRYPTRGDKVVGCDPTCPDGVVRELFHRGRVTILTTIGACVSVRIQRLSWSAKHRVWRCHTTAVVEEADRPLDIEPPGAEPRIGDFVRIEGWPLSKGGVVTKFRAGAVPREGVQRFEAVVVQTRAGELPIVRQAIALDPASGDWCANLTPAVELLRRPA
jgi:hypothetical protein